MKTEPLDLEAALDVARRAVARGAAAALRFFETGVRVERKPDHSPVTDADRAAEAAILDVLTAAYPDHAILAEESGACGGGPHRWIIDPIDGTKGFIRGLPFWGPIVATQRSRACWESSVIGVGASLPATPAVTLRFMRPLVAVIWRR